MPSIDERIVSMAFENQVFEQRVAQTMGTLNKLDASLKNMGSTTGFDKIDAQANKVTMQGPMSALDRLRAKFSSTSQGAQQDLNQVESSSNRISLKSPFRAIDNLISKFSSLRTGRTFTEIENDSNRVTLAGPSRAVDGLSTKFGQLRSGQTFAEIERSANQVTLGGMASAIENISSKFTMLQGVATVALGNIAAQAAMRGASFAKSFALGPLQQGFQEYGTNLSSIQTILANTSAQGTGLDDVNASLQELNHYSDQTIYNFSQMANSIGLFTAAGVDLDRSTAAIKGIANLAAMSGSSNEQATHAMQQLSQALAAGKVTMQDWISVRNAGMGGEVFQKALFDTAKAAGTITNSPVGQTFEEWRKAGNSFAKSLSEPQKAATSAASVMSKAQKDASDTIASAQRSAADAVESAQQRVKDAQKGVADAVKQTADDIKNAEDRVRDAQENVAETSRQSAESIKSAQESVKSAHQDAAATAQQSAQAVKDAIQAQADTVKQSADDVKSALTSVTEARQALVDAMKPPSADELQAATDRLSTAQLDQKDLASAVTDAQTEQKRASEDLATAQAKLAKLGPGATPEERIAAERAVEDAQKRVTDASDAQERALLAQRSAARGVNQAQKELTDTQNKGAKDSDAVKGAQDNLTAALDRYREAQVKARDAVVDADKKVTQARKDSVKAQQDANQRLEKAESDLTDTRRKAARDQLKASQQLIDAEQGVADARVKGAERQQAANDSLKKAQKDQVQTVKDSQDQISKAHEQATEKINQAKASLKPAGGNDTWLTSDVLTKTLKQFTGDMTDAQLKAQGFTADQIKAIRKMAETAKKAATEVKTLPQLFGVVRESIGSGWAQTFQLIFGNFTQAKKLFTDLSNYITGWTNKVGAARNAVLRDWNKLGGRATLITGIKSAFEDLMAVIKPIRDAFRDIFPATTGRQLFNFTTQFADLMHNLKPSEATIDNLRRIFTGFFAVVHIGWSIIKGLVGVIFDLFGAVGKGSGGFLGFVAGIGDFLTAIDRALTKGGALTGFFDGLSSVLQAPVRLISAFSRALANIFTPSAGGSFKSRAAEIDQFGKVLTPAERLVNRLKEAWRKLVDAFASAKSALEPWFSAFVGSLSGIGQVLSDAFSNLNFDTVLTAIQTGLVGGIFLMLKNSLGGGGVMSSLTGALDGIKNVLGGVTGQLGTMQKSVQAKTLLAIGAAILVLAGGVFILSTIDGPNLARAMTAVAVGLGELMGGLKLMTGGLGKFGALQLPLIAAGLIGMAIAVTILAAAMKIFSTMSWEDIAKGLAGVAGSLTAVGLGMKLLGPGTLVQGPALLLIAGALNLIALAVKQFGDMSWQEMGRGLLGVATSLLAIGAATTLMGPSLVFIGPGLVATALAMTMLAGAIKMFGSMDPTSLVQGIAGMAGALVALGAAILMIPPTAALQGAGLIVIAAGLASLAGALGVIGSLPLSVLVQGILGMGGALLVLAGGLMLMTGTLPASAALLAAGAAFLLLAPALAIMGNLSWGTLLKGLAAMAITMGVLAVVGAVAAGPLALLGGALIVLGLGMAAVSGAVYILAKGFALLGDSGAKGVSVMVVALTAFVAILPKIVIDFLKGLLDIVKTVADLAPKVVGALNTILDQLLSVIIKSAPKMAVAIGVLVLSILNVLTENVPRILTAGFQILQAFLSGISQNIGSVVTTVATIITKFLDALTAKVPDLVKSGANLLVAVLKGIADHIADVVKAAFNIVTKFLAQIAANIPKVVAMGARIIVSYLKAITGKIGDVIKAGVDMVLALMTGIQNAIPRLTRKALDVARTFLNSLAKGLAELADIGFKAIIKFLNGLEKAIRNNFQQLWNAGAGVADAIVDGLTGQFGKLGPVLKSALTSVFSLLPGWAKKILGISSPSKVFMAIGKDTMTGMAVGVKDGGSDVTDSMGDTADNVVDTGKAMFMGVNKAIGGINTRPVISPVLDLTQVKREAGTLSDLTTVDPIQARISAAQAAKNASIFEDTARQERVAAGEAVQAAPIVNFEQNNYSPDALSHIEIYRQTKNGLSQVKRGVGFSVSPSASNA